MTELPLQMKCLGNGIIVSPKGDPHHERTEASSTNTIVDLVTGNGTVFASQVKGALKSQCLLFGEAHHVR